MLPFLKCFNKKRGCYLRFFLTATAAIVVPIIVARAIPIIVIFIGVTELFSGRSEGPVGSVVGVSPFIKHNNLFYGESGLKVFL